ncbi:MAG TPA: biosynthetic-type acetolactate synthase large subunit [Bacteroidetes bacterium]|nr:biosynthetic-type acetolactate synthase large subunit [Bacteroidota bacterium]HIL57340.1 biosynthetic-type acetolactate synthase large subunit [Rhodothermales bacterium]
MTTATLPRPVHRATPTPASAPAPEAPRLTGADIFVKSLEAEGVEFVFGHPGGAIIKIYDAFAQLRPSFQHILVRHEQAGTHAAEGYAKATGKVGTVLVTSGPGATNTVTGIADAMLDSVPLVVFTGQVAVPLIGGDAFQEVDTMGVTRSVSKHSFQVRSAADLAPTIKAAYHIARTGRPGPVVVDLPKDILVEEAAFEYPESVELRGYRYEHPPQPEKVERAARMIRQSERPLLYVGGGTVSSGASGALTDLARTARIPVTTTLHGLGAFPETDELALGMLGMHGTYWANMAVQTCDLLIAVGARFDDRVTGKLEAWAPHAEVIHIEIDPSCVSKNVFADCAILGDVGEVLAQLAPHVEPKDTDAWLATIAEWRRQVEEPADDTPDDGRLRPLDVVQKLGARAGSRGVLTTDVGQHQMWAAQGFGFERTRSHITSGGLGTMGFGFPAAIGAALGLRDTDAVVVSINGDGGFLMNCQELGVAAKHRLPIKLAILNNSRLGMVRQWQELFFGERYSETDTSDTNPDFVALAEAFGCVGLRASTPDEADVVIAQAWEVHDRPVLMEFVVPNEEMVFPMVPAGAATDNMILKRFAPGE